MSNCRRSAERSRSSVSLVDCIAVSICLQRAKKSGPASIFVIPSASSWRTPPFSLARRGIAVRRRAVLVLPEGERPHPRLAHWHCRRLHDAADDAAVSEHVVIVLIPLAGWARGGRAFEDQLVSAVLAACSVAMIYLHSPQTMSAAG